MTNNIKWIFAALGLLVAAQSGAAQSADVTFGEKPTFQSDDKFEYGLSPDKKAFTLTFSNLEVGIDGGKMPDKVAKRMRSAATKAPVVTRVFSIVIPVNNGKPIKTSFFANGYVLTEQGAHGTLLFSVNGKNTLVRFGPKSDKSFLQKLDFKAASASDIRMTVFLLVERDGKYPGASAYLNVSAIDTDLAAAKKRAAAKGTK